MSEEMEHRDSLGNLPIRAGSTANSLTTSEQKLAEKIGQPLTPDYLSLQLSRLETMFGPPKDRTDGQKVMLAREWFAALKGYGANTVKLAIDKLVASWRFGWQGALAEAVSLCSKDDDGWRDALGLKDDPYRRRDVTRERIEGKPFCRDGRTEAEEIAHRAAQIRAMRQQYPAAEVAEEPKPDPKPASQAQWISPELRAIAIKRGYWQGEDQGDAA